MPTSSERLEARANAHLEAATAMEILASRSDDVLEVEEYDRLAERLNVEYDRLIKLAKQRKEKEKQLEHRRK